MKLVSGLVGKLSGRSSSKKEVADVDNEVVSPMSGEGSNGSIDSTQQSELVCLLLEAKANMKAVAANGLSPALMAADCKQFEIVKLLISSNAINIEATWPKSGNTLAHWVRLLRALIVIEFTVFTHQNLHVLLSFFFLNYM